MLAAKLRRSVKKHVFKVLQSLKISEAKRKKKLLELLPQQPHQLKLNVNKQSHLFAMKLVHLQLNSHQRLLEKR